MADLVILASLF